MRYLWDQGIRSFVELGPGNVLTGLIKRITPEAQLFNLASPQDLVSLATE
jgi:[acyl-carrier-protein] S-malonyltransferase